MTTTAIDKPSGADIHRLWSGEHPAGEHPTDVRRAEQKLAAVETWIGNHPAICLGAGLLAGAILGWLIKRK